MSTAEAQTAGQKLKTWWTILRIAIDERLVYRGDFALGTTMRFLPIVTQIFLWFAIFQSFGSDGVADGRIVGYSYRDFVAYYLLTMLSRAFSSMPALASTIALQVRDGEIKKYLIQPIDMIGFLFINRVAHKLAYYSVAFIPFGAVFWLCGDYFPEWPSIGTMACYVLTLGLAFVLGFFLEASLGIFSFWFLEVTSLLFIYMLMNFFLSGHMFPLDMLPEPWATIVEWLPLRYLAYFPAAVWLGKIQGEELVRGLIIEVLWVVFFIWLSRFMFARGVKRYSGFGG